ncbi:MAG: Gfo/Idh/MocA family oxidoreductase [Candidatus Glassbacteria bacterium]|nr:Gfo/Idh/MocA family oxidoreductase [Candidatus Glassbacteria bacterium]
MDKVRIGMVGSKFAADFHADSHARNPYADIVAVAALDGLDEYCEKWNVPESTTDYKDLCRRDDIDVIDVCVPNFLHYEVVMEAAANNKHVICEKPLATTVEHAREMVESCRKQGVLLMYAEDWVFAPALVRAIELINEGAVGEMLWIKAKEVHNGSHSPFAQQKKYCGGGSLFHLAVHPIGFVRYLFGEKVVEVNGWVTGGEDKNFYHKSYTGEDWGACMLKFESGRYAFCEGNYITVGGMDDKVEIYGSEGRLNIDLTFSSPIQAYSRSGFEYAIEKTDTTKHWTWPAVDEFANLGYVEQLRYFIDCVRKNEEPKFGVRGEDGLAAVEICLAAYESAETGKVVKGEF